MAPTIPLEYRDYRQEVRSLMDFLANFRALDHERPNLDAEIFFLTRISIKSCICVFCVVPGAESNHRHEDIQSTANRASASTY